MLPTKGLKTIQLNQVYSWFSVNKYIVTQIINAKGNKRLEIEQGTLGV